MWRYEVCYAAPGQDNIVGGSGVQKLQQQNPQIASYARAVAEKSPKTEAVQSTFQSTYRLFFRNPICSPFLN